MEIFFLFLVGHVFYIFSSFYIYFFLNGFKKIISFEVESTWKKNIVSINQTLKQFLILTTAAAVDPNTHSSLPNAFATALACHPWQANASIHLYIKIAIIYFSIASSPPSSTTTTELLSSLSPFFHSSHLFVLLNSLLQPWVRIKLQVILHLFPGVIG